jgi:hypothetical protein
MSRAAARGEGTQDAAASVMGARGAAARRVAGGGAL